LVWSWLKVWHLFIKPEPKLMALAVIKPYQLPPDHWIYSIWVE
jgi:hypothetical protein